MLGHPVGTDRLISSASEGANVAEKANKAQSNRTIRNPMSGLASFMILRTNRAVVREAQLRIVITRAKYKRARQKANS